MTRLVTEHGSNRLGAAPGPFLTFRSPSLGMGLAPDLREPPVEPACQERTLAGAALASLCLLVVVVHL